MIMKDYTPFVYFKDKTIVATKVIMVTDVYHVDTSFNKIYGFSIMVEGLSAPLSYTSPKEQDARDRHRSFMTNLRQTLRALNNWYD